VTDLDVHGPIDFLLMEFSGEGPRTKSVAALVDLLDRGIVRLYDLAAVRKEQDGSVTAIELVDPDLVPDFGRLGGARSGLISSEDIEEAGSAMAPGTTAVLLVYENSWAIPFVAAAISEGGMPIASARIPAVDVIAALDAIDA